MPGRQDLPAYNQDYSVYDEYGTPETQTVMPEAAASPFSGGNSYGYELNNLMQRYGVGSPVNPRQQSGQSDADFQALLGQYQNSVRSTPEYDIPKGGSPTYRELLKNTLYGDPKTYFQARGITDPFQKLNVSEQFGWRPEQFDASMGNPAGSAQQWIDQNRPSSVGATGGASQPTSPPSMESIAAQYSPQNSSTWSPEEKAYAQNYTPNTPAFDIDELDELKRYIETAKTGQFDPSNASEMTINPGEASQIFGSAQHLNLSPSDIAGLLGMEGVGGDEVVARLKQAYPHQAQNYLAQHGQNYAEGGMVTGYAEGGSVDPLDAILQRYMTQQAPDISGPREAVRANAEARRAAIEAMNVPQQGPSDNEKWLQLAAAFANPGQTGNFMEGVGNAAGALAGHNASKREFAAADQERQNQMALAALGVDQDLAESELSLSLADQGRQDAQLSDLMRHYEGQADREFQASEGEANRALQREIKPADDISARDQAQVRFLTTQYEGYLKAAQGAAEIGDDASAQFYAGLAEETASKIESMFGGAPAASRGPAPGAIVDGYEFVGGDPNDRGAWKPVTPAQPLPATGGSPGEPPPASPQTPAPDLGVLEGFNTQAPPRQNQNLQALRDIGSNIVEGVSGRFDERLQRQNENTTQMVRSVIESRDIYQLGSIPRSLLEDALESGMLTPEEVQLVTAYLAQK